MWQRECVWSDYVRPVFPNPAQAQAAVIARLEIILDGGAPITYSHGPRVRWPASVKARMREIIREARQRVRDAPPPGDG